VNPAAQKSQTTRLDEVEQAVARFGDAAVDQILALERQITAVETRLAGIEMGMDGARLALESLQRQIGDERTHRLKLADEQRAYVDTEDRRTRLRLEAFWGMGFLARWSWILRGR